MTPIKYNLPRQISDSLMPNQTYNGVYPVSRLQCSVFRLSVVLQVSVAGRLMG